MACRYAQLVSLMAQYSMHIQLVVWALEFVDIIMFIFAKHKTCPWLYTQFVYY